MKVVFETKRCKVGALNLVHKEGYKSLLSNPNVMDLIPLEVLNEEEINASLEAQIHNYLNPKPNEHIWAVEDSGLGKFIGTCGVRYQSNGEVEIEFKVLESFWRQKYGTEVCQALIEYVFTHTDAKRVIAIVNSQNFKAIKILERFLDYKGKKADTDLDVMHLHYGALRQQWLLRG